MTRFRSIIQPEDVLMMQSRSVFFQFDNGFLSVCTEAKPGSALDAQAEPPPCRGSLQGWPYRSTGCVGGVSWIGFSVWTEKSHQGMIYNINSNHCAQGNKQFELILNKHPIGFFQFRLKSGSFSKTPGGVSVWRSGAPPLTFEHQNHGFWTDGGGC